MFDILVDHQKKRLYACFILIGMILELVLWFDLRFAFDVLRSSSFTDLLNLQTQNGLSFYSYFFFSCVTSGVVYTALSIQTIFSYFALIIQAFTIWDWMLVVSMIFLMMSHRSALSKVTLCILIGFFVGRLLLLSGISLFLISGMQTNSAGTVLNRIELSSIIMIFSLSFAMIGNGYWIINLFKTKYLVLFKERGCNEINNS